MPRGIGIAASAERTGAALLAALALAMAWLSWSSIAHQAGLADLYQAASAVEEGQRPDDGLLGRRRADLAAIVARGDCDDQTLRAAVTVALADIDRQNVARDYDGWAAAVAGAERLQRHAVACSPHDGNFWARLAIVERMIAAAPARLAPLMAMSARLSPAELGVLEARFQVWRTGADWIVAAAPGALADDLRTVMTEAQLYDVKRILGKASGPLQAAARRVAEALPVDRRTELKRTGLFNDRQSRPKPAPTFDLLNSARR